MCQDFKVKTHNVDLIESVVMRSEQPNESHPHNENPDAKQ